MANLANDTRRVDARQSTLDQSNSAAVNNLERDYFDSSAPRDQLDMFRRELCEMQATEVVRGAGNAAFEIKTIETPGNPETTERRAGKSLQENAEKLRNITRQEAGAKGFDSRTADLAATMAANKATSTDQLFDRSSRGQEEEPDTSVEEEVDEPRTERGAEVEIEEEVKEGIEQEIEEEIGIEQEQEEAVELEIEPEREVGQEIDQELEHELKEEVEIGEELAVPEEQELELATETTVEEGISEEITDDVEEHTKEEYKVEREDPELTPEEEEELDQIVAMYAEKEGELAQEVEEK